MIFSRRQGTASRGFVRIGWIALLLPFGLPLADRVYHVPIQVAEVTDIVQYVDETPGVAAAFSLGLHASRTMLRPLRQAHAKMLLVAADRLSGRYHLVFRGTHAVLAIGLLALFVGAARPRSATDLVAVAFALAVLIGLHTFLGLVREAYPVNHFLVVVLYGLATLVVAQSRGGLLADAAAAVFVALSLLTLESGVLVAVVAAAAYTAGLRGISRAGLALIACVVIAYIALRLGYLGVESPPFGERATGFGLGMMSGEEQVRRFGARPWLLYAYTAVSGVMSVLFSQPREGVWTIASRWTDGDVPPWLAVHVLASIITTVFTLWFAFRLRPEGGRGYRDPLVAVAAVVLLANGALSFSYSKDEIVSFAGVFYALAVYAAARGWLRQVETLGPQARTATGVLLFAAGVLWSIRLIGTHDILREQAFQVRNEWAYLTPEPSNPLTLRLRLEALRVRTFGSRLVDARLSAWLGER
jgi:hypothetical protein